MRRYTQLLNELECDNFKVFDFDYIMPECYKPIFEDKFHKRYGYRNIGFETPFLFRQQLQSRLNELLPKYNQLYSSVDCFKNPFINNIMEIDQNEISKNRYKTIGARNLRSITTDQENIATLNKSLTSDFNRSKTGRQLTDNGNQSIKGIADQELNHQQDFTDSPQNQQTNDKFNDGYQTNRTNNHTDQHDIKSERTLSFNRISEETGDETNRELVSLDDNINQRDNININKAYNDNLDVHAEKSTKDNVIQSYGLKDVTLSAVLIEWRKSFISVDEMLLDELEDLFILIY